MSPFCGRRYKRVLFTSCFAAVAVFLTSAVVLAQEETTPKVELFTGYQWLNVGGSVPAPGHSPNAPVGQQLRDIPQGVGVTGEGVGVTGEGVGVLGVGAGAGPAGVPPAGPGLAIGPRTVAGAGLLGADAALAHVVADEAVRAAAGSHADAGRWITNRPEAGDSQRFREWHPA